MNIDYFDNLDRTVAAAIGEDVVDVDITAELIPADAMATATVITREAAIVAGRPWVDEVFRQIDPDVILLWHVDEGESCQPDTRLLTAEGKARSILTAERTALNFLQTLSGTATVTRRYTDLIAHTGATLLDTRKTLPGLRYAQKYAVSVGGGGNHRMGLSDAFLIKENHITAAGSIDTAIRHARERHPDRRLEIEVENLAQFHEASAASPDWIMLDNFTLADLESAVKSNHGRAKLEASGGIESDEDLVAIAETGVDYISVGALTKHVRATDLSLLL
ncbi:MAG: carboxylating nicotinate-nucleotide diphosphorylase [Gammaproteobacteria bacterium]|nr:carboxylating nicotinate-nucleotide diphosphorylase [Gammaproteobacteria bacterium]